MWFVEEEGDVEIIHGQCHLWQRGVRVDVKRPPVHRFGRWIFTFGGAQIYGLLRTHRVGGVFNRVMTVARIACPYILSHPADVRRGVS